MTAAQVEEGERESAAGGPTASTARGSLTGLLGSAVNAVAGFALVAVVTHGAGASGAGSVFTGVAVFTIASNALKLGADTALVRFVSMDRAATGGARTRVLLRTAVLPALVASLVVTAAVLLLPGASRALLPGLPAGEAVHVMRMFAWFLPMTTVTLVALGAARGYGTVLPFVGSEQIGKPLLRVLLAVPLVIWAPSVSALSLSWLLPSLAGLVIAGVSLRRLARSDAPAVPDPAGDRALRREFWAFAGPRAISSVFDITAVWIGVVLLSLLAGSRDAGVYTAVSRLITAGTLLQLAVRLAVAPQISGLLGGGRAEPAQDLHRLTTRWITLFSLPVFVVMAVFPHSVMSLFGGGFPAGATALVVLCGASAVNVMVGNAQTVILMAGRSTWNLSVAGAAFVTQVGLGLLLIPSHGVLGAAVAWGGAVVVDNVASALLVRHRLGFRTVDRRYAGAVAAGVLPAAVAGLVARGGLGDGVAGLAAGCAAGAAVYAAVLWRWRGPLGVSAFLGTVGRRG